MLPMMAIFLAVCAVDALVPLPPAGKPRATKLMAAVIVAAAFLAILSPYLRTNKRVFGRYFYNVNTTFYMWYDDWPAASVGTILHGDGVGWPAMPADQLPSASRYWREHSIRQIASRVGLGFADMVERSYTTYWYLNYVVLYLAFGVTLAVRYRNACAALVRGSPPSRCFSWRTR